MRLLSLLALFFILISQANAIDLFDFSFMKSSEDTSTTAVEGEEAEAKPVPQVNLPAQEGMSVKLVVLDRTTNRRDVRTLKVGDSFTKDTLDITAKACMPNREPQRGNNLDTAWLEVTERDHPLYIGWLRNYLPETTALEHPRYGLRFLGCQAA